MTLLELLEEGIHWIYKPPEFPKGALMTHHGIYSDKEVLLSNGRAVKLAIAPSALGRLPVIIIHVAKIEYSGGNVTNPLIEEEVTEVREAVGSALSEFDAEIANEWNGVGLDTGSFQSSQPANKGLIALVHRYRKGCQRGGPGHKLGSVFCPCGWQPDGEKLVDGPEGWV